MSIATKTKLADAIRQFGAGDPGANSIHLFNILGYNTTRSLYLSKSDYATFRDELGITATSGFNEKNALVSEWESVHLLFQLTAEEMKPQAPLFEPTLNREDPASFLFFTIRLKGNHYSRSQLAAIAREMNKPFAMDVFVLFQFGEFLTFSLIERRPNKKVLDRDVVSKVTHIYNISIAKPHAAHIQILYTFSFEAIEKESRKKRIQNFKELQLGWKKVVSTQVLNTQFYRDYQELSKKLIKAIGPQQPNKMLAHQGILNLLNRIMFIYFVQKKGWLMDDDNFIYHYWQAYQHEGLDGKDRFHKHWLNTVFFTAFNGQALKNGKAIAVLAEPYNQELFHFPYLNGGLFTYNKELDDFELSDKHFHEIFRFFESYIFTISEDTPYDVNLEINPELLGKMYEGMINATDLDDVDAEHGIVYTERPEINFMVRRSLVEVLDKKLDGAIPREALYHLVFDNDHERQPWLQQYKSLLPQLRQAICSLTACDPSCGSGSMLLGVIQVQMEMLRSIDAFLGKPHLPKDDFTIKKQLISDCIYGVDIKEWAVRIAELRLWLYMISEAEFSQQELQKEPLLPNLDFKLRCGNSLLQKFGELDFTIEDLLKRGKKSAGATRNLHNYIKKKKAFIQNQAASGTTYENLKAEEKAVFLDLIGEMIIEKEQQIHKRKVAQGSLFGEAKQGDLFAEQTEQLKTEIQQLKAVRQQIHKEKRLPFSYDIDFMEVFVAKDNDEEKGFDLVIGNPPYVRQEQILPPEDPVYLEKLMKPQNKTLKAKVNKEYKAMLNERVYKVYPWLGSTMVTTIDGKNKTVPVYGSKVPGRADLYVYFQLLCPHYLNSKGTFCFIISNSWMDVDFGSYIQHFLLKHTRMIAVYDCNMRSFEAAVNTVIYLHGSIGNLPVLRSNKYSFVKPLDNMARFIMNKVDYASASYSKLLIEQEAVIENKFSQNYRCIPLNQIDMYQSGYDIDDVKYSGDKWGGKNLRGPEIYYTVLGKGNGIFKKLNDVGKVFSVSWSRLGLNDSLMSKDITNFSEKGDIVPVLKSPRDVKKIHLNNQDLSNYLNVNNDIADKVVYAKMLWVDLRNDKHICHYCEEDIAFTHNFHGIQPNVENEGMNLCGYLNSTLSCLFIEIIGRTNLGEGAIRILANDLGRHFPTVIPNIPKPILKSFINRIQKDIIQEIGFDEEFPIRSQIPNPIPDRAALDKVVFDAIGLTEDERNEVYWSVAELVQQRLNKAASR